MADEGGAEVRLSDRLYDILKWVQKILVLAAALYSTIANIWGLPYGDEISKTCLALATFLLGILEIASATYNKEMNASLELTDAEIDSHEVEEGVG